MRKVGSDKQYFHYDHIGNLVQIVNASGQVAGDLFYTPFGEPMGETINQIDHNQPFGFSTKRADFASGLLYFGYGFYVPHMERWLNWDPIGINGGLNIYAYVGNNSLTYFDPDGLKSSFGVGGQIGSTTVGISGGYRWNSGAQWGQTTQIGIGFGIEVCFNLPDDDDNFDSGDGSDCDKNNDDVDPIPDNVTAGVGRHLGVKIGRDGSFCFSAGPSVGLPGGVGWDL